MLQDRIRGSLIGGAIGDALGYPVEFIYSFGEIQARYGERGITRLDTKQHWLPEEEQVGKAVVSDDTQMTLFTANGLLNAKENGWPGIKGITDAYVEWYLTQSDIFSYRYKNCWLRLLPELNVRRAPGVTCMSALKAIFLNKEPANDSKGCGGVMRIAPIPLYGVVPRKGSSDAPRQNRISIEDVAKLAGDAAKITHKHPLGYIPAALEAYIIYRLLLDESPTRENLENYIFEGLQTIHQLYSEHIQEVLELEDLVNLAVSKSHYYGNDVETVESLGGGWVGEEAVAIALYCALKHFDNFEEAMIAAVNHAGDSDSTGAVCGNILGAAIGYEAIPQFFKDDLEMQDLILIVADDLYHGESQKPFVNKDNCNCNLQPMPSEYVLIPMNIDIPASAMYSIVKGHMPKSMEDHWFMYCDKNTIRYYRSWTGICVYRATYRPNGRFCKIMELEVNRNPIEGNEAENEKDKNIFMALLTCEYGGDGSSYWEKAFEKGI